MRKLIKYLVIVICFLSFVVGGYSAYFMFVNNNYQLSRVAQPLKSNKITKQNEETKNVEYSPSVELTSPEQIEKARKDTSQPLYLRSYLSVPNLGINLQVFEGTSDRVLTYGAGTIKAGQNPDQIGNYALAAHNFFDRSYGIGFSNLQTSSNIEGSYAYLSDGDYVYTYKLVKTVDVHKDNSMIYTEDDFAEQLLQNEIKSTPSEIGTEERAPENVYTSDNTYTENADGKTFTYGKLLTLYTCKLEPGSQLISYNRIIVTGVQVKKEKLEETSEDVRNLFIDSSSKELDVTGVSEVPKEEQKQHQNQKEDKVNLQKLSYQEKGGNIIEYYIFPLLKKYPNLMMDSFWVSMGTFFVSALVLIFVPWKKVR